MKNIFNFKLFHQNCYGMRIFPHFVFVCNRKEHKGQWGMPSRAAHM